MQDTIIEISKLTRHFGRKTALQDISMKVSRGKVFGLVGENGAGKTTLIRHILGLLKAQAGSVRVFGLDPVADPTGVLGRIGYLSEDRNLPDWMRIDELMRYSQAFYPKWDEKFARELCDTFELTNRQKVKTLSRGQRARTGLLIALAHRPDLLVLDEPSSGLDPMVRRDILTAIIRTVADEGRNVLFSSHLLDEVERVSDDVAVLHNGRLVLCEPLESIASRYSRLTIRLKQAVTVPPALPGVLSYLGGENQEWTLICNGQIDQLREELARIAAQIVDEQPTTLDDVFVAFVRSEPSNPTAVNSEHHDHSQSSGDNK